MDRSESQNNGEHVIDITRSEGAFSPSISHDISREQLTPSTHDERLSSSGRALDLQPPQVSSDTSNRSNTSLIRRGTSRRRSPLNSGLWICIELALTLSQIVASIIVLSFSRHEHPHAPLKLWIVGYASGSLAILPLLYWRYCHRDQASEQDSNQRQFPIRENNSASLMFSLSVTGGSEQDNRTSGTRSRNSQSAQRINTRLKDLVEYFKMGLDCFFAIWFVVGNVWIFGGHSSALDAPNLYRLCIVFLTFSCIGYAMPFILCAILCCCFPCIISILGAREEQTQTRGATSESINSLPTYKFKVKKNKSSENRDSSSAVNDGGVVAAGTEKEREISGEDAICCICLAKYVNNDELRELPCSHFFHKDCVDKWLKINALCPLCKAEVGENILASLNNANAS